MKRERRRLRKHSENVFSMSKSSWMSLALCANAIVRGVHAQRIETNCNLGTKVLTRRFWKVDCMRQLHISGALYVRSGLSPPPMCVHAVLTKWRIIENDPCQSHALKKKDEPEQALKTADWLALLVNRACIDNTARVFARTKWRLWLTVAAQHNQIGGVEWTKRAQSMYF